MEWEALTTATVQELGNSIAEALPEIFGALIILVVGLFLAGFLGNVAHRALKATGIDSLVRNTPMGQRLDISPGRRFSPSKFIGWLIKWFFILVTLITVSSILGWSQINDFLNAVVLYVPNVIIAVAILVIGFIASEFVSSIVAATLERSPLEGHERRFLATTTKVAITVFAVMAALIQLRIAEDLIRTLFAGLVFALSLALGLAFGLGGREQASLLLKRYAERKNTPQSGEPFDLPRQ